MRLARDIMWLAALAVLAVNGQINGQPVFSLLFAALFGGLFVLFLIEWGDR